MNAFLVENAVEHIITGYEAIHVISTGDNSREHRMSYMMKQLTRAAQYRHDYQESELFSIHWNEDPERAASASLMMELQMALRFTSDYPEANEVMLAKYLNDQFRIYIMALAAEDFPEYSVSQLAKDNAKKVFHPTILGQQELQSALPLIDEWEVFEWTVNSFAMFSKEIRLAPANIVIEGEQDALRSLVPNFNVRQRGRQLFNQSVKYVCLLCQGRARSTKRNSVSCITCTQRLGHFHCIRNLLDNRLARCPSGRCHWFSKFTKPLVRTLDIECAIMKASRILDANDRLQ